MSADNGIFYRAIEGMWYVMESFWSNARTNEDYRREGEECATLESCLLAGHEIFGKGGSMVCGLIHDPSPEPPPDPLREVAQAILDDATERGWGYFAADRDTDETEPTGGARLLSKDLYRRLKELLE